MKPLNDFYQHPGMKDGHLHQCKICENKKTREYQKANKGKVANYTKKHREKYGETYKEKARNIKYQLSYGIGTKEYNVLFDQQSGRCAICGEKESHGRSEHLFINHCHKSGKIRGLLCNLCNGGIGKLKDNPNIIENALEYLKLHQPKMIIKLQA